MPEDADSLLDALPEPALVLGTGGGIERANRAALAHFGAPLAGRSLTELALGDPAPLKAYLARCSGSRSPLIGSFTVRDAAGRTRKCRCHGNVLTPARDGAAARVLLRCASGEDARFSALSARIRDLNAEIRKRRHAQAVLEETLRDRELLLRELNHRVKNNVQMLVGMLAAAEREAAGPDARAALHDAVQRLMAVGVVQQMLYRSESLRGIPSDELVRTLSDAILQTYGAPTVAVEAEPAELSNAVAVPLALILNELLANAVKHGLGRRPDGRIRVRFAAAGDGFELVVEDDGPGFDLQDSRKRASGLGLVRGLVRQLGGSLAVERAAGARCVLRFKDRGAVSDKAVRP